VYLTLFNISVDKMCDMMRRVCLHITKAGDTQRGYSACDAVGNGLSDTVLRLQPEPEKHVPVSGWQSSVSGGSSLCVAY